MQHWERTPLSALSIFPSALSVKEREMSREAKRLKLPTYEKWNWTDHSHPVPAINRGPTVNVEDHSRKQRLQPIGALDHGRCHSICQISIRPDRRLPERPPAPCRRRPRCVIPRVGAEVPFQWTINMQHYPFVSHIYSEADGDRWGAQLPKTGWH